ncbi:MAG: hypothetical protein WD875_12160 [Pirellulales bacterium]
MIQSTDGVIHGRTIELAEDLGLGEGQRVRVTVESAREALPWGEGIRRSAGAVADCGELDAIFESIQREHRLR